MKNYSLAFALAASLLLALTAHAQAPGSGGPTPQDPQNPQTPTDVPLDGGASLLLAGGVAFGLRKLRSRRR